MPRTKAMEPLEAAFKAYRELPEGDKVRLRDRIDGYEIASFENLDDDDQPAADAQPEPPKPRAVRKKKTPVAPEEGDAA